MKEPRKVKFFKIPMKRIEDALELGDTLPLIQTKMYQDKILDTTAIKSPYILISTFPKLNSKVCSLQTERMVQFCKNQDITLVNLSTDSYEQAKKWCLAHHYDINFYSDPQGIYLKKLGLYIPVLKVATRALLLFDSEHTLIYQEIVKPMSKIPNIERLERFIASHQQP